MDFVLVGVWGLGIAAGLAWSIDYDARPETQATPPKAWPQQSTIARSRKGATLVMFVHAHCPCSRASLAELESILRQHANDVAAYVCFVKEPQQPIDWVHSELWRQAASIPGVLVTCDESGEEARLFNARTSGQTLLYDARGNLAFAGGITAARGHFGPNRGSWLLESHIAQKTSARSTSPVFGCGLQSPGAECCKETQR
jgi:hypothetical protein